MVLFDQLKRALERNGAEVADPERAQRIAAAVLLLEMAHADDDRQTGEYAEIGRQLRTHFGLSRDEADELVAEARLRERESVSLHRYLKLLNDSMDYDARRRVL